METVVKSILERIAYLWSFIPTIGHHSQKPFPKINHPVLSVVYGTKFH